MKKFGSTHVVAIVFAIIMVLGILGFFNLNSFIKPVGAAILYGWDSEKTASQNIIAIEDTIENTVNENIGMKTWFIQINGLLNKVIGKNTIDDVDPSSKVYKLDNGYLSFVADKISDENLQSKASHISELNSFLNEKNIGFLYVQAPYKIDEYDQKLPVSVKDYSVNNAQRLCSMLSSSGVETLNLIDLIREQDKDWYSLYFKTDHHWNNEAAFWAYGELAKRLNADYGFEIDEKHFNPDNYTIRTYEGGFLGSQGKRVGSTYAGVDDINFFIPNFETSVTYKRDSLIYEGSFDDALLFDETGITGSIFNDFSYEASMGGNHALITVTNHIETNGKKVLLVKDSYANPVATHLAISVSELDVIDLRYFEAETNMTLTEYINQSNPDVVVMLYNPNALKDNSFFNY
ncbi:MAG: hypothetical protein IKU25_07870 [Clostridia bacterium]|nr:hypothetical protein [Clostridia bacterium]